MGRHADKPPRHKQSTHDLMAGDGSELDQRSYGRAARTESNRRIARTTEMRSHGESAADIETLPIGQVIQVFSLYCRVLYPGGEQLCVVRKTLTKTADTALVVGDQVRFRQWPGRAEAVVEQIMPRRTLLTRQTGRNNQPIVANADQMLIVASIREPAVKWGLIDRMIVAAKSGGLTPIICLNKIDLNDQGLPIPELDHYATLGITSIRASAATRMGLNTLTDALRGKATVLAGHSGVGKSSLITAIQPNIDIRVGEVSAATDKGRHTTTSARRYVLDIGGSVIDTPGVKLFGLWGVTRENLPEFFPDVAGEKAPDWRLESYERIAASLAG
jgi:ribosome biogenesis GTPase / thiamine phosphate phosphatase